MVTHVPVLQAEPIERDEGGIGRGVLTGNNGEPFAADEGHAGDLLHADGEESASGVVEHGRIGEGVAPPW